MKPYPFLRARSANSPKPDPAPSFWTPITRRFGYGRDRGAKARGLRTHFCADTASLAYPILRWRRCPVRPRRDRTHFCAYPILRVGYPHSGKQRCVPDSACGLDARAERSVPTSAGCSAKVMPARATLNSVYKHCSDGERSHTWFQLHPAAPHSVPFSAPARERVESRNRSPRKASAPARTQFCVAAKGGDAGQAVPISAQAGRISPQRRATEISVEGIPLRTRFCA